MPSDVVCDVMSRQSQHMQCILHNYQTAVLHTADYGYLSLLLSGGKIPLMPFSIFHAHGVLFERISPAPIVMRNSEEWYRSQFLVVSDSLETS